MHLFPKNDRRTRRNIDAWVTNTRERDQAWKDLGNMVDWDIAGVQTSSGIKINRWHLAKKLARSRRGQRKREEKLLRNKET